MGTQFGSLQIEKRREPKIPLTFTDEQRNRSQEKKLKRSKPKLEANRIRGCVRQRWWFQGLRREEVGIVIYESENHTEEEMRIQVSTSLAFLLILQSESLTPLFQDSSSGL